MLKNQKKENIHQANKPSGQSSCYSEEKEELSQTEWEIIELVAEGNTSEVIANKLNRSIHTIATHRKNIIKKLKLTGRYSLIQWWNEHTGNV